MRRQDLCRDPLWDVWIRLRERALSCVARLAVGEAEKTQLNRRFVPDGRPRRRQKLRSAQAQRLSPWLGHLEPERAAGRLLTPSGRPGSGKGRKTALRAGFGQAPAAPIAYSHRTASWPCRRRVAPRRDAAPDADDSITPFKPLISASPARRIVNAARSPQPQVPNLPPTCNPTTQDETRGQRTASFFLASALGTLADLNKRLYYHHCVSHVEYTEPRARARHLEDSSELQRAGP